jgi:hypothetical protein
MKIIFLDFDGVLNSHKWMEANQHLFDAQQIFMHSDVDREAVARVDRICKETGAKVVVSSTWRLFNTVERLQEILKNHGFTGEVIGRTAHLGGKRGGEIGKWLNEHGPVESFVILDDDGDMVHLMDRLIQTSFDLGLQDKHADIAIAMLMESK